MLVVFPRFGGSSELFEGLGNGADDKAAHHSGHISDEATSASAHADSEDSNSKDGNSKDGNSKDGKGAAQASGEIIFVVDQSHSMRGTALSDAR